MGTISALKRPAAGSPPPLSAARQKLAELIAADRQAGERLELLDRAKPRAYAAFEAAEAALAKAQEEAEQAKARAHEHNITALLGGPPAAIMTRREADARVREAHDAASDAEAAWRAIGAEADEIREGASDRQDRITAAAEQVLREECGGAVQALIAELNELHRAMAERSRLLQWMVRNHVTEDWGPKAQPGVGELISRTTQAPQTWSLWRGEASVVAEWSAALESLKHDAAAEIPR